MARETMQRTFTESEVKYGTIVVEGGKVTVVEHSPITVNGKLTTADAEKLLKKSNKNAKIVVLEITSKDVTYEMSIEEFKKYAKPRA